MAHKDEEEQSRLVQEEYRVTILRDLKDGQAYMEIWKNAASGKLDGWPYIPAIVERDVPGRTGPVRVQWWRDGQPVPQDEVAARFNPAQPGPPPDPTQEPPQSAPDPTRYHTRPASFSEILGRFRGHGTLKLKM